MSRSLMGFFILLWSIAILLAILPKDDKKQEPSWKPEPETVIQYDTMLTPKGDTVVVIQGSKIPSPR